MSEPKVLASDQGFWTIAWRQFCKDRVSIAGLGVVGLLAALAVFSPFLATGLPYRIQGTLTNFYATDVAAFLDWHKLYRERADELADAGRLRPAELAEKEAEAELYRSGLPRILDRLGTYMKPEDARALADVAGRYAALLEAPPAQLDREKHEELGAEVEERFGNLAFEPAYMQVAGPLVVLEHGRREGEVPLMKRAADAAEDLRTAREDGDAKAAEAARKKLEALSPELDAVARRIDAGVRAMTAFLEPDAASELGRAGEELGRAIRDLASPEASELAKNRIGELSSQVDAFGRRSVAAGRQRLATTTAYPLLDYLRPRDIGLVTLYLTMLAVVVLRRPFGRLTAKLPLDPSDLGLARLGIIVAPAILAALAWWAVVPGREPPADSYYKAFAEYVRGHPEDRESSIAFAPVPYGENEVIPPDTVKPPTWLEHRGSQAKRLRLPEDKLPAGVTEEHLAKWLEGEAPPPALGAWADAVIAKRMRPWRWHLLGTDKIGRDVLARVVIGSRVSLSVGFVAVGINVLVGVVLGALAGYFRGWTDIAISRFTEVVLCFPTLFLILAAIAMIQKPSIVNVMLVIGFTGWTSEMRLLRGEFLRLVNLDFVTAGRALGLSNARIIFRHMLPNAMAPVLVAATFGIAGAILTESALSFLGFGVPPPEASWGSVLNEALHAEKQMWWVTIFPGFMIFLTITAYNLVGEGFRDATDPRLRK